VSKHVAQTIVTPRVIARLILVIVGLLSLASIHRWGG
jgi:hypothetical protein